ncbi:deoxyribodipyrimidine photo-lyase [Gudongella sp. DL1XJH-153]|uniref:deoxyribodipyrimidine photo-lyase n=1 Tax=Gudongella sp. DL1XJH-153 TaxID=3409804 RepID=UPI003BB60ED9
MIQVERTRTLNDNKIADKPFIIYWMQSSQRVEYNHALQYAIRKANELEKPLLVYFGVTDSFPEANERHYRFMLEGLKEVRDDLRERNIGMLIEKVSPEKGALKISSNAALMVTDKGYLRIERTWRDYLASNAACPVVQVESNVMVPVETLSNKEEYSAATLRRKMNRLIDEFTATLTDDSIFISSLDIDLNLIEFDIDDLEKALGEMDIDRSVKPVEAYMGGTRHANSHLEDFIEDKLHKYSQLKNEPGLDYSSNLSPYLHFGQISPLYIYRRFLHVDHENKEDFLEELIVRRELAINFVYYNDNYDTLDSLHIWAKTTLNEHMDDKREYIYSLQEFENAKTHDVYWNAAQKEMILTGKMHGYMRMYWGKKILQWSKTPDEAFKTALFLNNKYNLDGRDPNGFAGVAWCFGKHDRGWKERDVFGKVRYMNAKGLERKFDMNRYLEKVESLQNE